MEPDDVNPQGRVLASRYRLEERLGAGGMSTVWAATDLRLESRVAVKLLDPNIAGNETSLSRFLREARTSAQLRNRFVVQAFDCGVDAGTPFIVMELLEGQTLRDRLRSRGCLSPSETARLLSDVARGIQAAHTAGIVHRDLKPENVFLVNDSEREFAKVLDFGVAKLSTPVKAAPDDFVTAPGSLFGTPNYMSPEQIDARIPVDHRTDIWAMAIVAFECLTGRVPFGEKTLREQFLAICARPLPVPSELARVPTGFDGWFARAAAHDPGERYQTASEASRDLCILCGFDTNSLAPTTGQSGVPPNPDDSRQPASHHRPSPSGDVDDGISKTPATDRARKAASHSDSDTANRSSRSSVAISPVPLRRVGWFSILGLLVGAFVLWRNKDTTEPNVAASAAQTSATAHSASESLPAIDSTAHTTTGGPIASAVPPTRAELADSSTAASAAPSNTIAPSVIPIESRTTAGAPGVQTGRKIGSAVPPKPSDLISRSVRPYTVPRGE